jgi:hypothetical protein
MPRRTDAAAALECYRELVFSPLDLPSPPRVDAARLVGWMTWARVEGHKRGLNAAERKYESDTGREYPWLVANVLLENRTHVEDSFAREFPEIERYAARFPGKRPGSLVLLAQRGDRDIFVHTDSDGYWGFRFYLANRKHEGLHFYLSRVPGPLPRRADDWAACVDVGTPRYARWPAENRPFCLNSVRAAHAVDRSTCELGERIACLVFPGGGPDEKKLLRLLARSTAKYRDYQIWHNAIGPADRALARDDHERADDGRRGRRAAATG